MYRKQDCSVKLLIRGSTARAEGVCVNGGGSTIPAACERGRLASFYGSFRCSWLGTKAGKWKIYILSIIYLGEKAKTRILLLFSFFFKIKVTFNLFFEEILSPDAARVCGFVYLFPWWCFYSNWFIRSYKEGNGSYEWHVL